MWHESLNKLAKPLFYDIREAEIFAKSLQKVDCPLYVMRDEMQT